MPTDAAQPPAELLIAAYCRTSYIIHGDPLRSIRLDGRRRAPSRCATRTVALITAWNPQSRRRSMGYNLAAAQRLQAHVRRLGFLSLPMSACPDDPDWPIERGLAIFGITAAAALRLAESFGQNALVYLRPNRAPELLTTSWFPPN